MRNFNAPQVLGLIRINPFKSSRKQKTTILSGGLSLVDYSDQISNNLLEDFDKLLKWFKLIW